MSPDKSQDYTKYCRYARGIWIQQDATTMMGSTSCPTPLDLTAARVQQILPEPLAAPFIAHYSWLELVHSEQTTGPCVMCRASGLVQHICSAHLHAQTRPPRQLVAAAEGQRGVTLAWLAPQRAHNLRTTLHIAGLGGSGRAGQVG